MQEHIWVRRIPVVNMYAAGRSVHRPDSLALVWRMCLFRSVDHNVGIQSISLPTEYISTESTLKCAGNRNSRIRILVILGRITSPYWYTYNPEVVILTHRY